ncbi:Pentatricopeptide repeat (PPR) superfamily protein isoform 2 [Hibiscus syriacus]|uniref:Pentatricopeptide repeat (PPR) superfamily protein isoform 2 n=1 Tax=Hibiscus syriacus TaxID=106335 RepID=A0A6A2ZAT9_HIBSY|nr:Pentatricopeptide repeat (PPR) superfamily protein isoform 2 [Hibiscus syriacus]
MKDGKTQAHVRKVFPTKPLQCIVLQVLSVMLQNRPFDAHLASSTISNPWTTDSVSDILRSVPKFFFQSPRSIGCQRGFRHGAPLKQRNLRQEKFKVSHNVLVLGPAAYRNPERVALGLGKAMEFYLWVENFFGFAHDEKTCKEMTLVLAKGNNLNGLWQFLKEMSMIANGRLVTTSTVTCLIKVLGEEGLVNEGLACFYRMKQFHCKPMLSRIMSLFMLFVEWGILIKRVCKPDVERQFEGGFTRRITCFTNRIGKALELFEDMNKRNRVPNRITYNSFIRYYCVVNEIDEGIEMRRRMQGMNHGVATNSSYTPIIHALCEAGRVLKAKDFLLESIAGGSIPREYTYKLVCDALNSAGAANLIDDDLHTRIRDGIETRCRQVTKVKHATNRIRNLEEV